MVNDFEVVEEGLVELSLRHGMVFHGAVFPFALLAADDEHGLSVREQQFERAQRDGVVELLRLVPCDCP